MLRDILHGCDCLLDPKAMLSAHTFTLHTTTATRVIYRDSTLTFPLPVASFFPRRSHPLFLSLFWPG